jgi:hypothetical protein
MKKIVFFLTLFFVFSSTNTFARDNIKDSYGFIMGSIVTSQKNDLLYIDFDFDEPTECQLKSITTNINGRSLTQKVNSPEGQNLTQHPNTYIAPRDAVLAYNISNSSSGYHTFNSKLNFNCDDYHVTAYTQGKYYVTTKSTPTPKRRLRNSWKSNFYSNYR